MKINSEVTMIPFSAENSLIENKDDVKEGIKFTEEILLFIDQNIK